MVTIKQETRKLILIVLLVVGILMLAVGGFLLSRYSSSTIAATLEPTAKETLLNASAFQTTELAINPVEVDPGVEVIITAQVTNTGDTEDTYTAGLEIDGVIVVTMEVAIATGESQPVSFVGAMVTPGTYEVTWVELIRELPVPRLIGEFVVIGIGEPM